MCVQIYLVTYLPNYIQIYIVNAFNSKIADELS